MSTLRILETFTGYPAGVRRTFTIGDVIDVEDVGQEFADLIITKGHAVAEEDTDHVPETVEREDKPGRRRGRVGD